MRRLILVCLLLGTGLTHAARPLDPVSIAVPGPGAAPMLPVDLIPKIGADEQEGLKVTLRHFGGGPLAIKDMLEGNSEFAAMGFSALVETKGIEGRAYAVANMVHVPAYTLMVSSALRGKIKTPADLRGRSIGVHNRSRAGISMGQQIVELILKQAGVPLQDVNFVSAGQSYKTYSAALLSGAVDAIVTNEPSATRLETAGIAYRLVDLHDPAVSKRYFGGQVEYVQLTARADVIRNQTYVVGRLIAALIRSLRWIQHHSAEEVADRLGMTDPQERASFIRFLDKNKGMYSPDAVFSEEQLKGAATLIRAVSAGKDGSPAFLDRFIDDRWVGRRP